MDRAGRNNSISNTREQSKMRDRICILIAPGAQNYSTVVPIVTLALRSVIVASSRTVFIIKLAFKSYNCCCYHESLIFCAETYLIDSTLDRRIDEVTFARMKLKPI